MHLFMYAPREEPTGILSIIYANKQGEWRRKKNPDIGKIRMAKPEIRINEECRNSNLTYSAFGNSALIRASGFGIRVSDAFSHYLPFHILIRAAPFAASTKLIFNGSERTSRSISMLIKCPPRDNSSVGFFRSRSLVLI